VKEGQEFAEAESIGTLSVVEHTLMEKLQAVNEKIRNTEDVDEIQKLSATLFSLLENLEKIRKLGKYKG